ncbi:helix-turn-helix domain-containing protein [Streptomyces sp. NPDC059696]|uniref:helix-turn-helix domain-containing protein n=1 Tax=Streptomyces sp. NPDC059696 TaxID=3346911 RepID=UPI003686AB4B
MSAQDDVDDVGEFAALLRTLKERTDRSYGSLARRLAMNTSTLHRYCAGEAVPVDFAPVERFAALCGASPQERLELHRRWLLAAAARQRPRTAATTATAATAGAAREGEIATGEDEPEQAQDAVDGLTTGPVPGPVDDPAAEAADDAVDDPASDAVDDPQPDAVDDPASDAVDDPQPDAMDDSGPDAVDDPASDAVDDPQPDAMDDSGPGPLDGPVGGPAADSPLPRRPWYRRRRVAVGLAAACAVLAALGSLAALPDGRRTPAGGRAGPAGPAPSAMTETKAPERRDASPTPSGVSPSPRRSSPSATPKQPKPPPTPSSRTTPSTGGSTSAPPLTWSADSQAWELGCAHDYVIARPPGQVAPPPVPQDAGVWAASQNAVHGGETLVRLTVQGRTDTAVVLEALRVRVVGRTAPAQGYAYAMDRGCGGAITPRSFDVNLDKDRPIARAVAGSDAGTPIPAVRMPYRVSARDPEVLLVNARTTACDCRWYLELDWSSEGRRGTVRIDDDGRPFRTSGIQGLPRYVYDTSARAWTPYS